jgi:DNA-binding HxlR family transcriptional regulator
MTKRRINFPIDLTLMLIGGKWKCAILCHLLDGAKRTGELRRMMFGITQKVLTEQLRELEADGLIHKAVTPGRVIKVEYTVTELGESLRQVIEGMCSWGEDYLARETNPGTSKSVPAWRGDGVPTQRTISA